MRGISKIIIIIIINMMLLVLPTLVSAKELGNEEILSETTKYYKTVTTYPNNYGMSTYSATSNSTDSYTVEVSEDEYGAQSDDFQLLNVSQTNALASSYVETTYKKLTISISKENTYYRYKTTLTWKSIPKVRSYDTIAIGFPASVKYKGTMDFTNEYCTTAGNCSTVTGYSYGYYGNNGVAATFKVPTGSLKSLKQTLATDIKKNTTATIVKQTAAGDYAHATETVSLTNAKKYTVGLAGIKHDTGAIISMYDEIDRADVTISCNW